MRLPPSPTLPVHPTAAVGAVFGLTSCIAAQVRQKPDDPLNYFLGGCAGGLTVGSRARLEHEPDPTPPALPWARARGQCPPVPLADPQPARAQALRLSLPEEPGCSPLCKGCKDSGPRGPQEE
ncbi:hypothetical protein P7K49_033056 [Saguinus oedipus]|uniref:NADH dehydrogenase [ubiquinone] 1 alpha subcomplex subunit 11 n=1 Tax=Saguinus oedipus TaxID=9490 RepID=A0ABQ9TQU3_SAGOE|nr:hypothetical protein P7K49_033056 [Saguinus oedipus]